MYCFVLESPEGGLTSLCLKLLPHFLNNLNETWYRSTCMVAMKCRCAWNIFHEARLIGSRAMVISLKSHSRMPVSKTTSTVFKPSTWTMLFLISCDKLKQRTWNSVIVLAHHAMWVFPNCKGYVQNKNIWKQKHRILYYWAWMLINDVTVKRLYQHQLWTTSYATHRYQTDLKSHPYKWISTGII